MAKNKAKNGLDSLPFPVRLAIQAKFKKVIKEQNLSPEEAEKVMQGIESLDLQTLLTDPDAWAKVKDNPGGELKNFMVENSENTD